MCKFEIGANSYEQKKARYEAARMWLKDILERQTGFGQELAVQSKVRSRNVRHLQNRMVNMCVAFTSRYRDAVCAADERATEGGGAISHWDVRKRHAVDYRAWHEFHEKARCDSQSGVSNLQWECRVKPPHGLERRVCEAELHACHE